MVLDNLWLRQQLATLAHRGLRPRLEGADRLFWVALGWADWAASLRARASGYHAVVANRYELDAAELVRWHREKAGTIEHVHRVMKDEVGAGGWCVNRRPLTMRILPPKTRAKPGGERRRVDES